MATIRDQITEELFSFEKLQQYGFWIVPEINEMPAMCITASDLQKYLKSIHDKIEELESGNISNGR